MIDFVCPRCGTAYHSDESHIGKQIRCTNPECQSLVPIVPRRPVRRATNKRQWTYAIAIPIAMLALCFLLLRQFLGPERGSATLRPSSPTPYLVVSPTPTSVRTPEDQNQATTITPPPGFSPDRPGSVRQRQTADPRPSAYHSLPSGTRIEPDIATGGHGKFTAKNGSDKDAVVRLSDIVTDQTVRWFFVQAGSSADVEQIPQGSYRVSFTTGLNWIESEDRFSWHPSYIEFEKTFVYAERQHVEGIESQKYRVTLNPVLFGNARTKEITREEFLKGHHHVDLQR